MAEQNSDHRNFNKEESPIPIPPVDQAWQSMQQKLDMELPVGKSLPPRSAIRHLWIKTIVMVTTVAAVTTALWLYSPKHNENTSLSGNTMNDTSLIATSAVVQADSLSDAMLRQSSSSLPDSLSDKQSGTVNNSLLSATSPKSSLLQSAGLVKSDAPLQSPVTNKQYPFQENTGQTTTGQQTGNQQPAQEMASDKQLPAGKANALSTDQQLADHQLLRSPASNKPHGVEKTRVAAQQTTDKQQVPVQLNTLKADHSAGETPALHPLQLTMIQTPFAKNNTCLQSKPDLLVHRQTGNRDKKKKWALYVQLNIPVPLSGDSLYFMGPNGKDQFYRNLIPALRVERKLWKGALSLDLQPAFSTALKSVTSKKDSSLPWSPYDTARSVLKQYGWGLALQYQVHIRDKWQIGAGIQTSFIRKAVVQQHVSDSSGYTASNIYPASPADKQDLSKVRISGMAELNYVAGKWQMGVRTLVPVTPVSKTGNISARSLNMEFVIRRKLWTK